VIQIVVPGLPRGKQRARTTRNGKLTYTPKQTVDAERLIAWEAKKLRLNRVLEGPVRLSFIARFPYPKSWSKKRRASTFWHTSKPDADNIMKLLKDALNKIVWRDDAQVAAFGACAKHYTPGEPGLWITIEELSDEL
jgi:Holliday junction resolvase RusA-like endonuclease